MTRLPKHASRTSGLRPWCSTKITRCRQVSRWRAARCHSWPQSYLRLLSSVSRMQSPPKRVTYMPSDWSYFRYSCCASPSARLFFTLGQVLTGEQPFRNVKATELAYHVSFGVRPDLPANAESIGISDSLWKLIRKCWEGEKTRRPRIQEVVTGVGRAAAKWHTDMPPSATEYREDSVVSEESGDNKHGESSCFLSHRLFLDLTRSWVIHEL